jgi:hypothetical protein
MRDMPEISGVWRLRAYYLETAHTGERMEPFGAKPRGALILHPEGRMTAVLKPAEQTPPVTDADQVNPFQKLVAYSGLYRLEPPDRFVTVVDIAWFQPWVGTEQARTFALIGETLNIVSAPTHTPLTGDALVVGVLSWVRESNLVRQQF